MAKDRLSREEKNKLKEDKRHAKLEKDRNRVIPLIKEPSVENEPSVKNEPIVLHSPSSIKEPSALETPTAHLIPKAQQNPDIYKSMYPEFFLTQKDIEGQWSWGLNRSQLDDDYEGIIEPYLNHPKNTKWGTLILETYGRENKTKHHHMDLGGLKVEIQDRWKEIELDYPEVFTFRLQGKQRLWGYRSVNKYFIVWWDPEHALIPM